MPRPVPGSTHSRGYLYGGIAGATWDETTESPTWDASSGTWDDSGAAFGEDASATGVYLFGEATTASGTVRMDADAETAWTGAPGVGLLAFDSDAGGQLYGRARAFWECDAEAGGEVTGHATAWLVSGLRMDAEAGASFEGFATGVGTLYCDADAGGEIWPRLRAIPESCLGAHTDAPGEAGGALSNYVY